MPDREYTVKTIELDLPRIAEALKVERARRGWSQAELGQRVGVRRAAISDWENCRVVDPTGKIVRALGMLDLDLADFTRSAGDEEDTNPVMIGSGRRRAELGMMSDVELTNRITTLFAQTSHEIMLLVAEIVERLSRRAESVTPPQAGAPGVLDPQDDDTHPHSDGPPSGKVNSR